MIQFKYTKSSGDISFRTGVILSSPSKNYSILDLTLVPPEELPSIAEVFRQYEVERKGLLEKYGLSNYVKSFKPEGISEVISV